MTQIIQGLVLCLFLPHYNQEILNTSLSLTQLSATHFSITDICTIYF